MIFEDLKLLYWKRFAKAEQNEENISEYAAKLYDECGKSVVKLAALVTALNHRCWYWYDKEESDLSILYSNLYYKYNDLVWDWLEADGTQEEKTWYFRIMD